MSFGRMINFRNLCKHKHLLNVNNVVMFLFCTLIIVSILVCIIIYFNNSVPVDIEISDNKIENTELYEYNIDKIETNQGTIKISGWALKRDTRINTWESYIVLKGIHENQSKVFKNFVDIRHDIKEKFNGVEYRYELSGFKTSISKAYLKEGKYKIYLLYKNNNENILIDLREEINV